MKDSGSGTCGYVPMPKQKGNICIRSTRYMIPEKPPILPPPRFIFTSFCS